MSDERIHHVTVRLAREYEFVARFDDVPAAPPLLLDEPEPLGHNGGPNPAALLSAAVGNCLAASLAFCLRRSRIEPAGLSAEITTHVTRNERGRFRISGIDVLLVPDIGDGVASRFARCQELFEDFCIVTQSVRDGIPVHVAVAELKGVA